VRLACVVGSHLIRPEYQTHGFQRHPGLSFRRAGSVRCEGPRCQPPRPGVLLLASQPACAYNYKTLGCSSGNGDGKERRGRRRERDNVTSASRRASTGPGGCSARDEHVPVVLYLTTALAPRPTRARKRGRGGRATRRTARPGPRGGGRTNSSARAGREPGTGIAVCLCGGEEETVRYATGPPGTGGCREPGACTHGQRARPPWLGPF
jgi:hypothetical protein